MLLNIVWPIFIIISFSYAIFSGNINNLNTSIFESTENAISLIINLLGTMCLWNGIMKIVQETSLMEKLTKILRPVMKWIFPDLRNNEKAYQDISMNIIANILGLGNAATPLGLKAMKTMQKDNSKKDRLSNSMVMFIVLNTASS